MTLWGAVIDPEKYQPYALPVPGSADSSTRPIVGQPMPTPGASGAPGTPGATGIPGDSASRRTVGPMLCGGLVTALYFWAF